MSKFVWDLLTLGYGAPTRTVPSGSLVRLLPEHARARIPLDIDNTAMIDLEPECCLCIIFASEESNITPRSGVTSQ